MKGFSPWPGRVSSGPSCVFETIVMRARALNSVMSFARARYARAYSFVRSYLADFALSFARSFVYIILYYQRLINDIEFVMQQRLSTLL